MQAFWAEATVLDLGFYIAQQSITYNWHFEETRRHPGEKNTRNRGSAKATEQTLCHESSRNRAVADIRR